MTTINEISILLLPDSRKIREEVSPMHIRCTPFDHAHVALFAAGVEALGLPDVHVKHRLALGSPVAGDLAPTHSWEESKEPSRPMGLDFDDLPHEQWNEFLHEDIARRVALEQECLSVEELIGKATATSMPPAVITALIESFEAKRAELEAFDKRKLGKMKKKWGIV